MKWRKDGGRQTERKLPEGSGSDGVELERGR